MALELRRVVVLTGPYGSGKTELAIGLAIEAARVARECGSTDVVALADIDVLKPYFRSREANDPLLAAGVELIAPAGSLSRSDLPILPAQVRGMVPRPDVRMILDVGGDPVGARALGSISDVVQASDYDMLLVLNRYRPFMESIDQVVQTAEQIQAASNLRLTGVISNTHMMDATTLADISWGLELATEVSSRLGIPIRLVGMPEHLEQDAASVDAPEIAIVRRRMKPGFLGGVVLSPPRRTVPAQ